MKSISEFEALYLHRSPVDFRKNINGLSIIVQEEMRLNLMSSSAFVFCNKPRTHIKILYFDKNGFSLWLKKLEQSKFPWPKNLKDAENVISVSLLNMQMLLDGINVFTKFEEVYFEKVM
jgi:transposase